MRIRFLLLAASLFFASPVARADAISVISVPTSTPPDGRQVGSKPFALPAVVTNIGCGSENEPLCEPGAVFQFSVAFTSGGTYGIFDPTGELSDFISISNGNGHGLVLFASDPTLP